MVYLERFAYLESGTVGRVLAGDWECYSIERPWLNNRPNVSCIPEGDYTCQPFSGNRFKDVVQIMDVPGRTFILFHTANWPHEVEGCIGVGNYFVSDARNPAVYNSKDTLAEFFDVAGKEFHLTIKGVRAYI